MKRSERGSRDDINKRPSERPSSRAKQENAQGTARPTPQPKAPRGTAPPAPASNAQNEETARQQASEQLSKELQRKKGIKPPSQTEGSKNDTQGTEIEKPPSFFNRKKAEFRERNEHFKSAWADDGFKEALNTQVKGMGNVLSKGLSLLFTPIGSRLFFRFMDTFGMKYFGGLIALVLIAFVVISSSIVLLFIGFIFFIVLIASAVMVILFVPDEAIDLSGIDFSGINGEDIASFDEVRGGASSAKGGVKTPSELKGKFLAHHADTSPKIGLFKDRRGARYHYGTDYDWSSDAGSTPVYPVAEGVVYFVSSYRGGCAQGTNNSYGNYVTIVHSNIIGENGKPFVSRYAHLKSAPAVKVGDTVNIGSVLGYIGTTGCSTGNHIHFELIPADPASAYQQNGVDPDNYLTCSADGKTVADFRSKLKGSHYHFPECFDYQRKIRSGS